MPRKCRSYDTKPWTSSPALSWGQSLSPVSREIQRNDLARAQRLSTGASPLPGSSSRKSWDYASRAELTKQADTPEADSLAPIHGALTQERGEPGGVANGDRLTVQSGVAYEAAHGKAVQGKTVEESPSTDAAVSSEQFATPESTRAVNNRGRGTPEVPSSIKNPLYEPSEAASIDSSSAMDPSSLNPSSLSNGQPGSREGRQSASFRSAIRRAADRHRQDRRDSQQATTSAADAEGSIERSHGQQLRQIEKTVRGRQSTPHSSKVRCSSGAPLPDEQDAIALCSGSQAMPASDLFSAGSGPWEASRLINHNPDENLQSQACGSHHGWVPAIDTASKRREKTRPAVLAGEASVRDDVTDTGAVAIADGATATAAASVTPESAASGLNPIWRLWNSAKQATESLQRGHSKEAGSLTSSRSVRCSLLESMNSVSDEHR